MLQPYKTTPVFDDVTLPESIRHEHRTKAGTWGVLRVLEGTVRLVFVDSGTSYAVMVDHPAHIPPERTHFVEVSGPMRLQVEFYRQRPDIAGAVND